MAEPMPLEPVHSDSLEPVSLDRLRASYLDLFYAVLFHPVRTFKRIAAEDLPGNRLLFYAFLSVVLISTIAPIVQMANAGGRPATLVITMPFSAVLGTLLWLFMAMVIAFLSYAFTSQTRIRTFLVLSGLATLPWLFMGPVSLLKIGIGTPGLILNALLGLVVWLWATLLFVLALMTTYRMSAERVIIILIMPLVMMLVFMGWVIGFITNIIQLSPL